MAGISKPRLEKTKAINNQTGEVKKKEKKPEVGLAPIDKEMIPPPGEKSSAGFLQKLGGAMTGVSLPGHLTVSAIQKKVDLVIDDTVKAYKWFHEHPELSGQEEKTASHLAEELRGIGLEVTSGIGGHGVVGVLKNGDGPVVLFRADMDALPISEESGVSYASKTDGVMHACGHDLHMANAVGTLSVLEQLKDQWRGTIIFVGQPSEENGQGARDLLSDPRFHEVVDEVGKPSFAVALHDSPEIAVGQVCLREGYATANVDSWDVTMHGKGGHGALPELALDPVVMGSSFVVALQELVAEYHARGEHVVATVGKFDAGKARNIIPESAKLELTIRTPSDEVRERFLRDVEATAKQVAGRLGAKRVPAIESAREVTPAVYNDPERTELLRKQFVATLGAENVTTHEQQRIGEDFARFFRELDVPSVMFHLGAAEPEQLTSDDAPTLHSPRWAPKPTPTLSTGLLVTAIAILSASPPPPPAPLPTE